MTLDGVDLGIDFEIREGGPAIGFSSPSSIIYSDDSVHLAYANTDAQILTYQDTPMLSVVAPLEKNHRYSWDPETYPDVEDLEDLRDLGVTINIFAGQTYAEIFVAQGALSADQIDPHTTQPLPASLQNRVQLLSRILLLLSHTPTRTSMRNGARMSLSHC